MVVFAPVQPQDARGERHRFLGDSHAACGGPAQRADGGKGPGHKLAVAVGDAALPSAVEKDKRQQTATGHRVRGNEWMKFLLTKLLVIASMLSMKASAI